MSTQCAAREERKHTRLQASWQRAIARRGLASRVIAIIRQQRTHSYLHPLSVRAACSLASLACLVASLPRNVPLHVRRHCLPRARLLSSQVVGTAPRYSHLFLSRARASTESQHRARVCWHVRCRLLCHATHRITHDKSGSEQIFRLTCC